MGKAYKCDICGKLTLDAYEVAGFGDVKDVCRGCYGKIDKTIEALMKDHRAAEKKKKEKEDEMDAACVWITRNLHECPAGPDCMASNDQCAECLKEYREKQKGGAK